MQNKKLLYLEKYLQIMMFSGGIKNESNKVGIYFKEIFLIH